MTNIDSIKLSANYVDINEKFNIIRRYYDSLEHPKSADIKSIVKTLEEKTIIELLKKNIENGYGKNNTFTTHMTVALLELIRDETILKQFYKEVLSIIKNNVLEKNDALKLIIIQILDDNKNLELIDTELAKIILLFSLKYIPTFVFLEIDEIIKKASQKNNNNQNEIDFEFDDKKTLLFYCEDIRSLDKILSYAPNIYHKDINGKNAFEHIKNNEVILKILSKIPNVRLNSEVSERVLKEAYEDRSSYIPLNECAALNLAENLANSTKEHAKKLLILMRENGIDITSEILKHLIKTGLSLNEKSDDGVPLFFYISNAHTLEQYASQINVNLTDNQGRNALFHNKENYEILNVLIKNKIDIYHKDNIGTPQLFYINNSETIQHLIYNNIDIYTTDNEGRNILFYLNNEKEKILDILIKNKFDTNRLDNNGHSALYYLMNTQYSDGTSLYKKLIDHRAKYIRNNIEEKNLLHLSATLDSQPDQNMLKNPEIINKQDLEQGKTPLHYAIEHANDKAALILLNNNANYFILDKYNRSPLDYAILYGKKQLIKAILSKNISVSTVKNLTDPSTFLPSFNSKQKYKAPIQNTLWRRENKIEEKMLSSYIEACYSGDIECYNLVSTNIEPLTDPIDVYVHKAISSGIFTLSELDNFSPKEQLVIISAIVAVINKTPKSHLINDELLPYIRNNILPQIRANKNKNLENPLGIEIETPNLPSFTLVPSNILLYLFDTSSVMDNSVQHHAFIKKTSEEIVTPVITNSAQLQDNLFLLEQIYEYGGLANKSTGLHVHINIRGKKNEGIPSIAERMKLPDNLDSSEAELMVVKQILINWSHVEPILRGFMRGGELFEYKKNSYARPIHNEINDLMDSSSLDDMAIKIDRYTALNVSSLSTVLANGHGTLEFRMHEGSTNPEIIKAWLNFIDRLVNMSVDQVQEKIDKQDKIDEFTAHPNIEYLPYILLAERDYNKTWDPKLKMPRGTSILPAEGERPFQIDIMESPLYNAFLLKRQNKDYDHLRPKIKDELKHFDKDIDNMLKIIKEYPGITDFSNNSSNMQPMKN